MSVTQDYKNNPDFHRIHIRLARANIAAQEAAGYDCAGQREVLATWVDHAKHLGLCIVCALLIAAGPILEAAGLLRG